MTARMMMGRARQVAARRSLLVALGTGVQALPSVAYRKLKMIKLPAIIRPGIIPARNRSTMDSSVITPYTIIGIDGGISMPSVPPAAIKPNTKGRWYPRSVISLMATLPMVAAVATDDPEIAEKIVHEAKVAIPKQPGKCPTEECTELNKSSA